jgi:outer membrane protein assembly factor BamE (lipoprotein component of BamABCDE complex)
MSATRSVFAVAVATAAALASSALFLSAPAIAVAAVPSVDVSFLGTRSARVSEGAILKVQSGMTRNDIVTLIGQPLRTMRFPLSRTTAWDYGFVDSWGYASEFSVIFDDDGVVVGKVTSRNDY